MGEPLSVAAVLERAADLIEPEGKWTQGDSARDANGNRLRAGTEEGAVCWCVLGAISKVVGHPASLLFGAAQKALASVLPSEILPIFDDDGDELPIEASWNDAPERTQAEVVAKLREAAALAKAVSPQEMKG
jgi:hypothetical protein